MRIKLNLLALLAALMAALMLPSGASAAVYDVNTTVMSADGACTSLAIGNGCTIRDAFDAASMGAAGIDDTINIPAGIYTLQTGSVLDIGSPGDGRLTVVGAGMTTTIIRADTGNPNVLLSANAGAGTTISDLTLQGATTVTGQASLLRSDATDTTIQRVRFMDGLTDNAGAVILNGAASTVLIEDSIFTNNSGTDGAALTIGNLTTTIRRTEISSNSSTAAGGSGAIVAYAGVNDVTVNISDSTIHGNTSNGGESAIRVHGDGGGIDGNVNLRNVTIANNTADNDNLNGESPAAIGIDGSSQLTMGNTLMLFNGNSVGTPGTCRSIGPAAFTSTGGNALDVAGTGACAVLAGSDFLGTILGVGTYGNHGGESNTYDLQLDAVDLVDQGLPANCSGAGRLMDQRGGVRSIGPCDVGAFELGGIANLGTSVTQVASGTVGTPITSTVSMSNAGPDLVRLPSLTMTLPTGASNVSVSPAAGCVVTASSVICAPTDINLSQTLNYQLTFTPTVAGNTTVGVAADHDGVDLVAANDTAFASTAVTASATTTTPTIGALPKAVLNAFGKTLKVNSKRKFTVKFTCPTGVTGGSCKSTLTMTSTKKFGAPGATKKKRAFACSAGSVTSGSTKTVVCTVPKKIRKVLPATGKVAFAAVVSSKSSGSAQRATSSGKVTLKF